MTEQNPAIEGSRKRYLVWLQDSRLEAFVLDNEADLQIFLQGYTTIDPSLLESLYPSALATDMRDSSNVE